MEEVMEIKSMLTETDSRREGREVTDINDILARRRGDLRGANLSGANLSGVKGYLCPSTWVASQELCPDGRGIIVYKAFGLLYSPPFAWKIEPGAVIEEGVNPDRGTECG